MDRAGAGGRVALLIAAIVAACALGSADRAPLLSPGTGGPAVAANAVAEGADDAVLGQRQGLVGVDRDATAKRRNVDDAPPPVTDGGVGRTAPMLGLLLLIAAGVLSMRLHVGFERRGPPALLF